MPDYPKDPIANLKFRQSVIQRAASDLVFRDYLLKKCESDPLFFINVFGFTHDPRRDPAKLPFITYSYQDTLITELDAAVNNGTTFVSRSPATWVCRGASASGCCGGGDSSRISRS